MRNIKVIPAIAILAIINCLLLIGFYLADDTVAEAEVSEPKLRGVKFDKDATWFYEGTFCSECNYLYNYDKFPKEIEIWHWPIASIESVKYTDADGDTQTVTSTYYGTDLVNKPARIIPVGSYSWPDTKIIPNAVQVQYKTGFTSPSVCPADLKQALYMILSDWFDNREDKGRRFPRVAEKILNRYKYR